MTKKQKESFIKKVAKTVQKLAPEYGIKVASPIIAQCIIESGWGASTLAKQYNNYFGIKAGTAWKGKSVNLKTQEEYAPGTVTTITDAFRVYDSMEDGIRGYFDLIQLPRYANLKGVTDPGTYAKLIKQDGYATDSKYVDNIMSVINEHGLTKYDTLDDVVIILAPEEPAQDKAPLLAAEEEKPAENSTPLLVAEEPADDVIVIGEEPKKDETVVINPVDTAEDYLAVWRSWVGFNETDGSFRQIIDIYNSHFPRARGYAVKYTDEWCDTTVSAAAIKAGMVDLIGTECGCEEHVKIFKEKGIWIEDGSITPKPGDIIVFSWRTAVQPNDSYSSHIGVVAAVKNGVITTIEGNKDEAVGYRSIPVGWGYIRGFARPKYGGSQESVRQEVGGNTLGGVTTSSGSGTLGKNPKWAGTVTASLLNVRTWAGTSYPNIKSYPLLSIGTVVEVCDQLTANDGSAWYYIRIAGQVYGFVSAAFISRV